MSLDRPPDFCSQFLIHVYVYFMTDKLLLKLFIKIDHVAFIFVKLLLNSDQKRFQRRCSKIPKNIQQDN